MSVAVAVACVACLAAVFFDVRVRRIPNFLTLPLVLIGIVLPLLHGWGPLASTLIQLAWLLVGGVLLHRTGWLGGGDIKLAIGVGLLLGYPRSVVFLLCTGIAGGMIALGVALARGRTAMLAGQLRSAITSFVTRSAAISPLATAPIDERIPYAFAIAAGLAATLLLTALDPARFGT